MRPRIDKEPTFDPLQLFTSEGPVEGTQPTSRALTRWRPTFVPIADDRPPLLRSSRGTRAKRFGLAAVASLACGILVGFASGYISAQRLLPSAATPGAAVPLAQSPTSAPAASEALPGGDATQLASEPRAPQPASGAVAAGSPARSGPARESTPESLNVPVEPQAQSAVGREPAGAAVQPREGSIEVVSRPPGADVALDGRVVGQTPLTIPDVEEGTHVIGIELSGFSRWATSVRVEAGKPTRVGASLTP